MIARYKSPMLDRIIREERNREITRIVVDTISIFVILAALFWLLTEVG